MVTQLACYSTTRSDPAETPAVSPCVRAGCRACRVAWLHCSSRRSGPALHSLLWSSLRDTASYGPARGHHRLGLRGVPRDLGGCRVLWSGTRAPSYRAGSLCDNARVANRQAGHGRWHRHADLRRASLHMRPFADWATSPWTVVASVRRFGGWKMCFLRPHPSRPLPLRALRPRGTFHRLAQGGAVCRTRHAGEAHVRAFQPPGRYGPGR